MNSNLIDTIFKYYDRPYSDDNQYATLYRTINGDKYTVHRFNHGVLYALRQGLLAIDIIDLFKKYSHLIIQSKNQKLINFFIWINEKSNDPYFKQKIMFVSSMQRSGRESEVSSKENPELYNRYERWDASNFAHESQKYTNMFINQPNEINIYQEAILWSTIAESKINENKCLDLFYIRRIIHTAHLLDLRRIPFFDPDRIKKEATETLFSGMDWDYQNDFINKLFHISGIYLDMTGDRDVVKNKKSIDDKFFILSNNKKLLISILNKKLKII